MGGLTPIGGRLAHTPWRDWLTPIGSEQRSGAGRVSVWMLCRKSTVQSLVIRRALYRKACQTIAGQRRRSSTVLSETKTVAVIEKITATLFDRSSPLEGRGSSRCGVLLTAPDGEPSGPMRSPPQTSRRCSPEGSAALRTPSKPPAEKSPCLAPRSARERLQPRSSRWHSRWGS